MVIDTRHEGTRRVCQSMTAVRNYNEAYHLTGDRVVVPVVRRLARHVLEPLSAVGAKDKAAVA